MKAWFLNLGPSTTTNNEAYRDINAILDTNPTLLVGCEAIGKGNLPPVGRLNGERSTKIRDTTMPGRANLFAYVQADDVEYKWTDCIQEFPRNKGPGQHWPRSILQFPFRGEQIVVAHKPPLWKGAGPARAEHDNKLYSIMQPGPNRQRSRMLLWDSNGMTGAETLADRIDGRVIGKHIDCAIVRNIEIIDRQYKTGIDGHKFATDHPWGALFVRFKFKND